MLTAALFTTAKTQKQPECPSMDDVMNTQGISLRLRGWGQAGACSQELNLGPTP